jgi:hypothetical protein
MYTAAWDDLEVPQIGSSQLLGKMKKIFQTTNQLQYVSVDYVFLPHVFHRCFRPRIGAHVHASG